MLLPQYPVIGRFYLQGVDRYVTFSEENGGTKYVLDNGKSGLLPLVSRVKVKEVMSKLFNKPVQPLFYGF